MTRHHNLIWMAAAALLAASPALAAEEGDLVDTGVGCKSAKPYKTFEETYATDGRVAAYKELSGHDGCARLPEEVQVKLLEAVAAFDYGWGKGHIWKVTPQPDTKMTPKEFYIRIRTDS